MSAPILIVDDDYSVATSLALLLKQAGLPAKTAESPERALTALEREPFDLILQDMNFSRKTTGEEGLALLREIKARWPRIPVILMTAWGSIPLAVQGIRAGASDFVTKPWTNEQIVHTVKTTLGVAAAHAGSRQAEPPSRETLDQRYDFRRIIGRDPRMLRLLDLIGRVSATDASVLITGETGVGKELFAEAIHNNSPRRERALIKVNLGGIPASLFESELFGHVKGAFTDAKQDRQGRFALADRGAIFLDEIGDIDPACQVKLLRVLQDRTYEPLGSSKMQRVDVRVISATNRNLVDMVEKREFREDLLYRLNLITLHIPPLRERTGDIPVIASHALTAIGHTYRRPGVSITDDALLWLQSQPWPGNVRQLKQVVERAVLMASDDRLDTDAMQRALSAASGETPPSPQAPGGAMTLDEMEKALIVRSLEQCHGNVSRVAEALGLSRAALYRRFEKHGIRV